MEGNQPERLTARSGDPILRLDGRSLASSHDPRLESRQWLEQNRAKIAVCDRVVVAGVGSGYHLALLHEEFPRLRVLAIALEPALIDAVRRIHGLGVANIEFHVPDSESQVLASGRVRAFLKSAVGVLSHPPSQALAPVAYQELTARLRMREPLFFADWLGREPRFSGLFPIQAIPGGEEKRLLSIKDLHRFLGDAPRGTGGDVFLVRALKELVR